MSRAFIRESDGSEFDDLPERPISPHRNLVTAEGLQLIERNLAQLERELAEARSADDRSAVARAERDLRYWRQRRASAEVIASQTAPEVVRFGCTVTLRNDAGDTYQFRIVGEDESDPARGFISYVSPIAASLLGARAGERVDLRGEPAQVVRID